MSKHKTYKPVNVMLLIDAVLPRRYINIYLIHYNYNNSRHYKCTIGALKCKCTSAADMCNSHITKSTQRLHYLNGKVINDGEWLLWVVAFQRNQERSNNNVFILHSRSDSH